MPYKSEKIKLDPTQDRRRKLTDDQKEEIIKIYKSGVCGMRPLAEKYGVSRSMIQILVNPERAAYVKKYKKENWSKYVKRGAEWNRIVAKHRKYKQELYLKGELKDEEV